MSQDEFSRRVWLAGTAAWAAPKKEEEVSPAEDLMREHGVLRRILLIYREVIGRIDSKRQFPRDALLSAAKLVRAFVEDYHEKLEEDYLFPRFRKANRLVDLVNVLNGQHQKGRVLTARILAQKDLRQDLHLFVRMYEPHAAREDTVLFPAFHEMLPEREYAALGEDFERKENQLFGQAGFEKNVNAVAKLEQELGMYDLGQFTPNV